MNLRLSRSLFALALLGASCAALHAQWRTQQIQLTPGWNSVFLEVDPESRVCEDVLQGIPVESVWLYSARAAAPQFVSDPRRLTPETPDWLVHMPGAANPAASAVSTLFAMPGGRPYLVKLAAPTNVTWSIRGTPAIRAARFEPRAFNFVGFHLDPATQVSVQNFFAPNSALRGQPVYDLQPNGEWRAVATPGSTFLRPGRAYWVYAANATEYSGPTAVIPGGQGAIAFANAGASASLQLANRSAARRTLTLRLLPSETPPSGTPANAGGLVLGYRPEGSKPYAALPSPHTVVLEAGQSDELELELRRQAMANFAIPAGATSARYQSLLEITDGFGTRVFLPLSAEAARPLDPVASSASGRSLRRGAAPSGDSNPASPHAGLWLGSVLIRSVSEPRNALDPQSPRPAAGDFQFRVILHVDASGQARLLRDALILFKPGKLSPVPGTPFNELEEPGEYVIATDESLLALRDAQGNAIYQGSTLRDGRRIGRRMSAVNFAFDQPLVLAGGFGTNGAVATASHTLGFDHPLNPLKHTYHPDHDNKDRQFVKFASGGEESWDLTRNFRFEFGTAPADPDIAAPAGLGSELLTGVYAETITGLHKNPIRVSGIFTIQRALFVNELNDGR